MGSRAAEPAFVSGRQDSKHRADPYFACEPVGQWHAWPPMTKNDNFASMMEEAARGGTDRMARRLERGQLVEGTVVQIGGDTLFLDVGLPADARLERGEVLNSDGTLSVKVGDRIRAKVIDASSDSPRLALSMGRGGAALDNSELLLARDSGTPVEGTIAEVIKGGLQVDVGGLRAFCPASQIDTNYIEDLSSFVGQTLKFQVLEVRDGGRSVVVSRKKLLEAERRAASEALRSTLTIGQQVEGTVVATKPHGAIVDLGGIDGYIHISELAQQRVRSVEDVVRVGETVQVRILSLEEGDRGPRIRLSLVVSASAAGSGAAKPPGNEVLVATVQSANQGGLIVSTSRGEGFVPTREIELAPGADHRRAYPPGTELSVVALGPGNGGQLRLSAKQVRDVVERTNYQDFARSGGQSGGGSLGSLGDLFRERFGIPAATADSETPSVASPAPAAAAFVIAKSEELPIPNRTPAGVVRRAKTTR